jgi:hypothetical protein
MYLSGYKYRLVRDQILHKALRVSWNLITWQTGIYIPIDTYKWYLIRVIFQFWNMIQTSLYIISDDSTAWLKYDFSVCGAVHLWDILFFYVGIHGCKQTLCMYMYFVSSFNAETWPRQKRSLGSFLNER